MADCQLFNHRVLSRNADRVSFGSIAATADVTDARFLDRLSSGSNGTTVEGACGIDPTLGTAVGTG